MYNDFSSGTKREGWVYTYKGSELLDAATRKKVEYAASETLARNQISDLYRDASVAASNDKIEALKREIDRIGKLHEQCDVFVHEFKRAPDREYHLSLGDVTFFELQK